MASGGRRMVINTQERAVSTDINRLQQFLARDRAEMWRYLIDVSAGADDLDAGAVDTEFTSQENPLRGEVMNGLTVQPQIGSLNILVAPGAAFVLDPDSTPSADDSAYKLINDPGVQTLGSLTITGNASGSTRIDVIECQRTESIVETDNRDIFNPSTGLFAATTVTKGMKSIFTYRVRAGTPAGGFPGTSQGWMPLAVASVPTGTTTCDTITFWDVRPLVNDRAFGMSNMTRDLSRKGAQFGRVDFNSGVSALSGVFERTIGNRRVGGRMRPGVPLTDAQLVDLLNSANVAFGQAPTNTSFYYVWLCTPFGLPRWARYTDSGSGTRKPRSPRGIPIVSNIAPDKNGNPLSPITLPASTGLGGSTSAAALITAGRTDGSANPLGMTFDGLVQYNAVDPPQILNTSGTTTSWTWTLTDNTHFPANARAIWVRMTMQPALSATTTYNFASMYVSLQDAAGHEVARIPAADMYANNFAGAEKDPMISMIVRIPIPSEYPTVVPGGRLIVLNWTNYIGTFAAFSNGLLFVYGWELGD